MDIFDSGITSEVYPKVDTVEIVTDFRRNYYVCKIYEDENPRTSNFELFNEEYYNIDSQEVIVGVPELEPDKRYSLRFRVVTDFNYYDLDGDMRVEYIEGTLKELK